MCFNKNNFFGKRKFFSDSYYRYYSGFLRLFCSCLKHTQRSTLEVTFLWQGWQFNYFYSSIRKTKRGGLKHCSFLQWKNNILTIFLKLVFCNFLLKMVCLFFPVVPPFRNDWVFESTMGAQISKSLCTDHSLYTVKVWMKKMTLHLFVEC